MILALLSRRLRAWFLLTLVLPLVGRGLRTAGDRVAPRNKRLAGALTRAGELAGAPAERSRRRRRLPSLAR